MNWTGGSLQRSKANPKGVLQKQKAHFARARIQLQNAPHGVPLHRPSLLQPDKHSRRRHSPQAQATTREPTSGNKSVSRPARQRALLISKTARRKRECNDMATDPEERLLETRRKRLLQQNDWAGLTRAKPAGLTFRSAEEKKMIGRRRKLKDHGIRAIKKKSETPPQRRQVENGSRYGPYMRGALPTKDVSIRFGSGALISVASRIVSSSSSTSEEMLFDNEATHTEPVLPPARSGHDNHSAFVGVDHPEWANDLRRTPTYWGQTSGMFERKDGDGLDQHVQETNETEGHHLVQQVGGFTRPLRLVQDPLAPAEADASHEHVPGSARWNKEGIPFQARHVNSGKVCRPVIDDDADALWRSFLPNSIASSSISDSDAGDTANAAYGLIPLAARGMKQTRAAWSPHATQSIQTHRSPSVSSSLPSITRYCEDGCAHVGGRGTRRDDEQDAQQWDAARPDVASGQVFEKRPRHCRGR